MSVNIKKVNRNLWEEKNRCVPAMHELQKVYFAFQGSRDATGFIWNAQLTAQVKRDSHVV